MAFTAVQNIIDRITGNVDKYREPPGGYPTTGTRPVTPERYRKIHKAIDREVRRIKREVYLRKFILQAQLLSLKVRFALLGLRCKLARYRHDRLFNRHPRPPFGAG